jgi:hypothetical protein
MGEVLSSSLQEFDDHLKRRYRNISREVLISEADKSEEQQGQLTYVRCCEANVKLEHREVPEHFVPGCFNILADDVIVWWHPSYKHVFDTDNNDE